MRCAISLTKCYQLLLDMTIDDAFDKLQAHFMTPAHRDTFTTEWNTINFADIRQGVTIPRHVHT